MPSPIAHSATGYIIYKIFKIKRKRILGKLSSIYEALVVIAITNVADLDFAFGIFTGGNYHRGFTHSISFALIFSIAIAFLLSQLNQVLLYKVFVFSLMIYSSHLLLDFFTTGGDGMLLLWPFSNNYYKSNFPIFPPVRHDLGLFTPVHIVFISFELVYSLVIFFLLYIYQKYYAANINTRKE